MKTNRAEGRVGSRCRLRRPWLAAAAGGVSCLLVAAGVSAQPWLDDARARIEQHRKAELAVHVVDARGNPVPGAEVSVAMQAHAFQFGTAVTARLITDPSPTGQTYRQKLLENFNHVVFENDLKWPPWDGLWGNGFNWPQTRAALDWLDANDLPARGHYLSWATDAGGDDYDGGDNDHSTLKSRLFQHITDKATTVGERVYEWDVINHPIGWTGVTYENDPDIGEGTAILKQIVDHARSVVPEGVDLWINEDDVIAGNSRADDYERVIQYLIDQGSPVDGIGFQGHFIEQWGRVSNTPASQLYGRIDRFAALSDRLRVTEFDIDVGGDEARQAQLLRDYLTVMFSHPQMEAVTLWGFWAGAHWRGQDGALYRHDWSEKPSLAAYRDLVFGEWWTDETGETDELGRFILRAFKGGYEITVRYDGQDYVVPGYVLDKDGVVEVAIDGIVGLIPGDADGDGDVDAFDLSIWQTRFGMSGESLPADFDNDGDVDGFDLGIWQSNFGAGEVAAVPEPSAALLLTAGFVGAVHRCCRVERHGDRVAGVLVRSRQAAQAAPPSVAPSRSEPVR